jgi:RNA polymerase sigma-70 factor (ECF subfamily)
MEHDSDVETLYRAYRQPIRRAVLRRIDDAWRAEEIVQETFVRALHAQREAGLRLNDPLPWLHTIARNLCIDDMRRRATSPVSEPFHTDEMSEHSGARAPSASLDATFDSVAERADARAIGRHLRRAFDSLAPRERRIVLMKEEHEMTWEEIAAAEGVTVHAARNAGWRARGRLRAMLPRGPFGWVPAPLVLCARRVRAWCARMVRDTSDGTEAFAMRLGIVGLVAVTAITAAPKPPAANGAPPRGRAVAEATVVPRADREPSTRGRGSGGGRPSTSAPPRSGLISVDYDLPPHSGRVAPPRGRFTVFVTTPDGHRVGDSFWWRCRGEPQWIPKGSPVTTSCGSDG